MGESIRILFNVCIGLLRTSCLRESGVARRGLTVSACIREAVLFTCSRGQQGCAEVLKAADVLGAETLDLVDRLCDVSESSA